MRLHLPLAILTAILLVLSLQNNRHRFTFSQVEAIAEKQSHEKYVPLQNVLPPQLKNLTPEQENGIFWNDAYRLWRKKGLTFQVDFYHVNKSFPQAPEINAVGRNGGVSALRYSPSMFRFSGLTFHPPLSNNLGFSGFYLRYPINKPDSLDSFFSVQGANYFRVLAKDQVYGLPTRAIAINTGLTDKKEEFPEFSRWWLQEPAPNASEMTLDALLDGPSVAGAYEFKVRPGAVTTVNVHAVLFFRQAVERLGLAPLTSMYLFGENAKDHFGDNFHPEIHDSDGLLMNKNNGEWVWRPLAQAKFMQFYEFPDQNPRGFGLIQRDREFLHYLDPAAKYHIRPSAWITPRGNWGKGVVQLTQLPTNNTNTDNVVLFWRPEKSPRAGDRVELNYTVDYYMNDATRPPLAYARDTYLADPAPAPPAPAAAPPVASASARTASPAPTPPVVSPPASPNGTTPVQFNIDFMGNGIDAIPDNQPPQLVLTSTPPMDNSPTGTLLRESKVEKNKDHTWRVTFTIVPFKHNVPTELLCHLARDGKPLTETWSYTWHQ